eukprot:1141874-Pelagomonas_calceolata.AAC.1
MKESKRKGAVHEGKAGTEPILGQICKWPLFVIACIWQAHDRRPWLHLKLNIENKSELVSDAAFTTKQFSQSSICRRNGLGLVHSRLFNKGLAAGNAQCLQASLGIQGLQGVGLQPENLADRLL